MIPFFGIKYKKWMKFKKHIMGEVNLENQLNFILPTNLPSSEHEVVIQVWEGWFVVLKWKI